MGTSVAATMDDRKLLTDTLILGLGKTGLSCARFLAAQGEPFTVADSREQPPGLESFRTEFPGVQVMLGKFDGDILSSAGLLIISPGISVDEPAIQQAVVTGTELIGDIELFVRHANAPIVAVTGSNGKSTVATLIAAMIEKAGFDVALGGNIGTPALSLLGQGKQDFYVLELSSFQLETVWSMNAAAAVVLNISADHLDRHHNIQRYVSAKEKIYEGDGCMVINRDDRSVCAMIREDRRMLTYTLSSPGAGEFGLRISDGTEWICFDDKPLLRSSDVLITGRHNLANALAALALGKSIGLVDSAMISVLTEFRGLPHRCELIANVNGVEWINDSKGTNPGASCAAIEGLAERGNLVLIAGGDGKGADFATLAESVAGRVHSVVLIGRDARRIAAVLEGKVKVCFATGMDAAVNTAAKLARSGDKVLLSPACASFDMFRDYQDRGQRFAEAVYRLRDTGNVND